MHFVLRTNNIHKLEELRGSKLFKKDVPCCIHCMGVYIIFLMCV